MKVRTDKYNDARKILRILGIRPPNYLAEGVYATIERRGWVWNKDTGWQPSK